MRQEPLTSLSFKPISREDLRLNGNLECSHAAHALYIYKHPCLLRDSNPFPTAPQSASLTTILDGRQFIYLWQPFFSMEYLQRTIHVKSVEAQTSSRWLGVEVRRGKGQLRCRSHHLTMVQNYVVHPQ
ncbi:uncharacterized protein TNCV_3968821 [Trichonephila clavipes]|nr:uncharacterized protein TNCV_3968821 [Trichonephila clavipes]